MDTQVRKILYFMDVYKRIYSGIAWCCAVRLQKCLSAMNVCRGNLTVYILHY